MSEDGPIAFETEREVRKTKGLKINGAKSLFQEQVSQRQVAEKVKESFENKSEQFIANRHLQQAKGFELAKSFMNIFRDKTLVINKGLLAKEVEKDLREDLQHFIIDLNNDPEQKFDGMGSTAAIALVLKSLFEMRDRVNELEYEVSVLKKQILSSKT